VPIAEAVGKDLAGEELFLEALTSNSMNGGARLHITGIVQGVGSPLIFILPTGLAWPVGSKHIGGVDMKWTASPVSRPLSSSER